MGINQIFVLLGQCLLLLLFYLMHRKSLIPLAIQRFKDLKKHIILIIVVLIAMYLAQFLYGNLIELLPENISLIILKIINKLRNSLRRDGFGQYYF